MRLWLPFLVLALLSIGARAQRAPSDVELRSAYCLGVVQIRARELGSIKAPYSSAVLERAAADAREDAARLQAYLLPKIGDLEPLAISAAHTRAKADADRATSDFTACGNGCVDGPISKTNVDAAMACTNKCMEKSEATQRLKRCQPIDWIPF